MTKLLNTKLKIELRTPSEINLPLKNTAKTREFLHKWANLEYGQPKGFSSADNGAIHVALMAWFKGAENSKAMECMDQYNNLEANVTNLVPYNDFVNCARVALGKNL